MYRFILAILTTLNIIAFSSKAHSEGVLDVINANHQDMAFDTQRHMPAGTGVFSPYSLFCSLSMVYQGASAKTSDAMQKTMHLTLTHKSLPIAIKKWQKQLELIPNLYVSNSVWVEQEFSILPEYQNILQEKYLAKIQPLDFSDSALAAETINSHVAEKTKGTITNLLEKSDLNEKTRLVLVNTVYYQNNWLNPFTRTTNADFTNDRGIKNPTCMMEKTESCSYMENELFQLALFPLEDTRMSMLVILPKQIRGFGQVEKLLTSGYLKDCLSKVSEKSLHINLPKFSITQKIDFNPILKEMGMGIAFTDNADFSGITGIPNLCIDKVVQQVVFECSEKGLKASAATGISMGLTCLPGFEEPSIEFNANHPFLFFLIDHTQKILFAGKMRSVEKCLTK